MRWRLRIPEGTEKDWMPHFDKEEMELAFDIYNCTVTSWQSEKTLQSNASKTSESKRTRRGNVGKTCGKCGEDMATCVVAHVLQSRAVKTSHKTEEDLWKLFLARLHLNLKWALGIEPEPVPPSGSAFGYKMLNPFFALGPSGKGVLNDQYCIKSEDLEALKGLIHLSPEAIDYPKEADKLGRTERTFKVMYQQYRRIIQGTLQEFPAPDLSHRVFLDQSASEVQKQLLDSAASAHAQQAGDQSGSNRTSAEASVSGHTGAEGSSSSQTSPERNPAVEKSDLAKPSDNQFDDQSDEETPSGNQLNKPMLSAKNLNKRDPSKRSEKRKSSLPKPDDEYRPEDHPSDTSRSSMELDED